MKHKILIADDEAPIQQVLAKTFSADEYEILGARDGIDALRVAQTLEPSVILLDINMPGKNGWDVLRALRSHSSTRAIPILVLTGNPPASRIAGSTLFDADDIITKPFSPDDVKARVVFSLQRSQRALWVSPLTHLPTGPIIAEEVRRRLDDGEKFALIEIGIENFHPYNEAYGYSRGDAVIQAAADMILEALAEGNPDASFAGHPGGNNFVVATAPKTAVRFAQTLAKKFDLAVTNFYEPEDNLRGYIETRGKQEEPRRWAMMSLSIGGTSTLIRQFENFEEMSNAAANLRDASRGRGTRMLSRCAFDSGLWISTPGREARSQKSSRDQPRF